MQPDEPAQGEGSGYVFQLGRYYLIEKIGSGGMGSVWRGQDGFGNEVAVKVLLNPADTEQTARLEREARVMAQLQHRNICHVYEFGRQDDMAYIAMEYVRGATLSGVTSATVGSVRPGANVFQRWAAGFIQAFQPRRRRLMKKKREAQADKPAFTDERALELFYKVCDGVAFAHEKGILHRDLKPGNILLREDGEPLVADFGLAKLNVAGEASLSMTGQIFGTLAYMAPEQALSAKDADERADVYSLGAILYYLLSGHRAFRPTGNIALDCHRLQNHQPIALRKHRPDLPADLELIVMKALQNDSRERYLNAAALRDDVGRYLHGDAVFAQPLTLRYMLRRLYLRHKLAAWTAAVIFTLFLATVSASLWQINDKRLAAERALADSIRSQRQADQARQAADRWREEQIVALQKEGEALALRKSALEEKAAALNEKEAALAEVKKARLDRDSESARRQEVEERLQKSNEQLRVLTASSGSVKASYLDTLVPVGTDRKKAAQAMLDAAEKEFIAVYTPASMEKRRAEPTNNWSPDDRSAGVDYMRLHGWHLDVMLRFGRSVFSAVMLDPSSVRAALDVARYYLAVGDFERAVEFKERARNLMPYEGTHGRAAALQAEGRDFEMTAMKQYNPGEFAAAQSAVSSPVTRAALYALEVNWVSLVPMDFGAPSPEERFGIVRNFLLPVPEELAFLIHEQSKSWEFSVLFEREAATEAQLDYKRVVCSGPGVHSFKPLEEIFCDRSKGRLAPARTISELDVSRTTPQWLPYLPGVKVAQLNAILSQVQAISPLPEGLQEADFSGTKLNRAELVSLDVFKANAAILPNASRLFLGRIKRLELTGTAIDRIPIVQLGLTLEQTAAGLPPEQSAGPETFRFTPALVQDQASLANLRAYKNLKFIGADNDPPDQTAAEFWKKFDAGAYAVPGAAQ